MARIITGHTGVDHITSDDVSSLQQGLVGVEDYLLSDNPDEFVATVNSDGTIRLSKGDVLVQGTHIRVLDSDVVTLPAGVSGTTRIDSICVKYSCEDGIEDAEIVVVKGTTSAPNLTQEDIRNGGAVRYVALFNVTLNGTSISKIERVIHCVNSLNAIQGLINAISIQLNNIDKNDKAQATTITTLQNALKTLQSQVNTVAANKVFTSPMTISNKGKQNEAMYVDLQAYVSTYDEKTAANDILAYRIAICDKNHTANNYFTYYSNGNHAITVDGKFYSQPFIQRGAVSITPKTKVNETVGTVTISSKNYTVKRDFYNNSATITFAKPYGSTPNVVVTPHSSAGKDLHYGVTDLNNKGFKIYCERTNTTATIFDWVAFGTF